MGSVAAHTSHIRLLSYCVRGRAVPSSRAAAGRLATGGFRSPGRRSPRLPRARRRPGGEQVERAGTTQSTQEAGAGRDRDLVRDRDRCRPAHRSRARSRPRLPADTPTAPGSPISAPGIPGWRPLRPRPGRGRRGALRPGTGCRHLPPGRTQDGVFIVHGATMARHRPGTPPWEHGTPRTLAGRVAAGYSFVGFVDLLPRDVRAASC